MTRLNEVFAEARADGRAALIGYLPAGFPTRADALPVIEAMVENGVDIVEVGLPYSDPLMDGPVIAAAVTAALAAGIRTRDVLKLVEGVAATGAPALVMSYWNPIERFGLDSFGAALAAAGGSGVITPDLTPEEAEPWIAATDEHGIDRIFLVAPSSSQARLAKVTSVTTGFVYAASTMGVTGTRTSVSGDARQLVERVRQHTNLPVCVGLGVSTAAQAAEIAAYADGVIVGSAFVRALQEASSPAAGAAAVAHLAGELAAGVRAGRR
ncbi:MAG: tryptophan synthase subunit alpha [Actinomycetes bacterium]